MILLFVYIPGVQIFVRFLVIEQEKEYMPSPGFEPRTFCMWSQCATIRPQGIVRLPPIIQINITWSTLPEWGYFWYWFNLHYFPYVTQLSQKFWYCLVLCEVLILFLSLKLEVGLIIHIFSIFQVLFGNFVKSGELSTLNNVNVVLRKMATGRRWECRTSFLPK